MRNRWLPIAFVVLFTSAGLCAQTVVSSTEQTEPHPKYSDWPTKIAGEYFSPLEIVTISQPGIRHICKLKEVTTDSLTCGRGKKAVVYQRSDVAATISPPDHSDRHAVITYYVVSAVSLAGSFFVPIEGVSIFLRVVSGYAFFTPVWDNGPFDHNDDILLYQHPDTPFTVHLHQPVRRHK